MNIFSKISHNREKIFSTIFILGEIGFLVYLLSWHYRLGRVRFFDSDEYAYLHWGYIFSIGDKPYAGFYYLLPPFFLYPLALVFHVFKRTIESIIAVRIMMFCFYALAVGIFALLGKALRNLRVALLAACIFVFLPIPYDKTIEIRPDVFALFLAFAGMYLFFLGTAGGKRSVMVLSGICYGLSMGVVPKTMFLLFPVLFYLLYEFFIQATGGKYSLKKDKETAPFTVGLSSIGLLILGLIAYFGDLRTGLYSVTKLASDVHRVLGAKFYIHALSFFSPVGGIYFGPWGYTPQWILNALVYYLGASFGMVRLVVSLTYREKGKCIREFVFAMAFFLNFIAYLYYFPLKHTQYLIPVAPFVSFYFADMLFSIPRFRNYDSRSRLLKKIVTFPLKFPWRYAVIAAVLVAVWFGNNQMNNMKVMWGNQNNLNKVSAIMHTIPEGSPVFDLTGETIFYPNGYYFCCLMYGQYEEVLKFKYPPIGVEMEKRGTKYVYTGDWGRVTALPSSHYRYINDNFVPYWQDKSLLIRK